MDQACSLWCSFPCFRFGLLGTPGQGLAGGRGLGCLHALVSAPGFLAVRAPQGLGAEARMMAPESTGDLKAQGREQWLVGHRAGRWEVSTALHPGVAPTC